MKTYTAGLALCGLCLSSLAVILPPPVPVISSVTVTNIRGDPITYSPCWSVVDITGTNETLTVVSLQTGTPTVTNADTIVSGPFDSLLLIRWTGDPSGRYRVQSSADLHTWQTVSPPLTNAAGSFEWGVGLDTEKKFLRVQKQ